MSNFKIISLLPGATEIVAALGLTDAIVARSHECDYPLEVQDLPVCTEARLNSDKPSSDIDKDVKELANAALSIYNIKIEVIQELQPTHILTQDQCDVCAVSFAEVEKAVSQLVDSQPQIISLQPNILTDLWADIERVANILNVNSQPLLNSLQSRVEAVTEKTKVLSKEARPTVAALEWIDPLMATGNWIPELIKLAGSQSLFGVVGEHSPYLDWENLAKANPENIIIMPCGFDLERTRQEVKTLTQHSEWSNLQAVKNGKVFLTDGNAYFNRPGPRLVDSLEILAEILHPDLFDYGYLGKGWEKLS